MAGDPWAILGIDRSASPTEARRAYLLRSQLLHPDRHQGAPPEILAEADRSMRELTEAWDAVRRGFGENVAPPAEPASGGAPEEGLPEEAGACIDWVLTRLSEAARDQGRPMAADELARLRRPVADVTLNRRFRHWLDDRRTTLRRATAGGNPADWARAWRVLADADVRVVLLLLLQGTGSNTSN
jgi:curved DNA-binding protein CbpA